VLLLGAVIAVLTGVAYNAAAALQKHEALQVPYAKAGILVSLVKRKVWVAATILSLLAWVGQVAALALAPIALVVPLLAIGSAVLVVLGVVYLRERFRLVELIGVAFIVIGAAAASGAESGSTASRIHLGNSEQILIAVVAIGAAAIVSRSSSGLALGAASGIGFAAVALFSKEVGDRFADRGFAAVPHLLAGPTPWLLLAVTIPALSLLQAGFQRANAASVMAALAVPEAIGPLIAGFSLYHERYPHGAAAAILPAGLMCAVIGSVLLARGRRLGEPLHAEHGSAAL